MRQVVIDPKVMVVVEINKMSENLKKAFNLLEVIQKGLNAVSYPTVSPAMFLPF